MLKSRAGARHLGKSSHKCRRKEQRQRAETPKTPRVTGSWGRGEHRADGIGKEVRAEPRGILFLV